MVLVRESVIARCSGPLAIAAAAVAMFAWGWRKWPDVLVDHGQELYVAWRLAEGQVLYSDLAYHYGPLSPYVNSVIFRLFGPGLSTLAIWNIVWLAAITVLIYRLLRRVGSRLAAAIGGLVFVTVFALAQLVEFGNYNFVSPYVHGLTHGLGLSLGMIAALDAYSRCRRRRWLWLAGVLLGLVFLTKAEVFLAAALGATTILLLPVVTNPSARKGAARRAALFVAGAAAPVLVAFLLLCLAMPAAAAARGVLGSWPLVLGGEATTYYEVGAGLGDAGAALGAIGVVVLGYLVLFGGGAALSLQLRRPEFQRRLFAGAAFVLVAGALVAMDVQWSSAVRPLPLALLLLGALAIRPLLRQDGPKTISPDTVLYVGWIVFALALLAKMPLNTRTHHYGFALAMPGTLLLVVVLVDRLPAWVNRRGGYGALVTAVVLAACLAFVHGHLEQTRFWFGRKTQAVGRDADRLLAGMRGEFVQSMLEEIDRRLADGDTLTAVPDGGMIQYQVRRVNPTPFLYHMPSDLAIYGEDRMVAGFEGHAPDFIVLTHKDTSELGARFFGRDYGNRLFAWIQQRYCPVKLIGAPPLEDDRFGLLLLKRSDDDPTRTAADLAEWTRACRSEQDRGIGSLVLEAAD